MRFAAIMLLGIAFAGTPSIGACAEGTVLRLTMQQSSQDPIGQIILQFKKDVESRTKGAITIDVRDNGQLYPDYQVPEVIGGGTVEMGVTQLAQFSHFVPVAGVFMQPFLFNFEGIVRAASKPGGNIRAIIDSAILRETGARVLWWQPYGWNVIFSKGAVANPKTLASRNVRVFDDVAAEFVKLCGGTPQVISESKQVEALDLGLVDATLASAASLKNYDLWRKTDTISDIRHSANIMVTLVNDDIWKKMPFEQKAVLVDAAMAAEIAAWSNFKTVEAETYALAKAKGMSIERPASSDLVEWRVCSSPILESFLSLAGGPGMDLMAAYGKLRADPCCEADPTAAQAGALGAPRSKF